MVADGTVKEGMVMFLSFRGQSLYVARLVATGALLASPLADAQPDNNVVPAHEHETPAAKALDGPTETKGVESVRQLGSTALKRDIPALAGRALRARELKIAPGGVVAAHTHEARPGLAYILSGEILEYRSDHAKPILRRQGDVAFEYGGVSHWWQNASDQPVRALVVDIVEQPKK